MTLPCNLYGTSSPALKSRAFFMDKDGRYAAGAWVRGTLANYYLRELERRQAMLCGWSRRAQERRAADHSLTLKIRLERVRRKGMPELTAIFFNRSGVLQITPIPFFRTCAARSQGWRVGVPQITPLLLKYAWRGCAGRECLNSLRSILIGAACCRSLPYSKSTAGKGAPEFTAIY